MSMLVSIFLLALLPLSYSEVRYVYTLNESDCPHDSSMCHNLSFYMDQPGQYFTENAVFVFLEGTHHLPNPLLIEGVNNLTLMGEADMKVGFHDTVMQTNVIISCTKERGGGIIFLNVTRLSLIGLTVVECSVSPADIVEHSESLYNFYSYLNNTSSYINNSRIFFSSLFLLEINDLIFREMSVQNTTHFGLVAINLFNSSITSSSFAINNIESFEQCGSDLTAGEFNCSGGNVIVFYTYSWVLNCSAISMTTQLDICSTNFSYGFGYADYDTINEWGGGITVFMNQGNFYHANVNMDKITAYNNTCQLCGNVNFLAGPGTKYFSFSLANSVSSFGNQKLKRNDRSSGGGLLVSLGGSYSPLAPSHECNQYNNLSELNTSLNFINTYFTQNTAQYGGGVNLWINDTSVKILLQSCEMVRNYGTKGIGLYVNQNSFDTSPSLIKNVTISHSVYKFDNLQLLDTSSSSMVMYKVANLQIEDLVVENNFPNYGIFMYQSKVDFGGEDNVFRNCSSLRSGGGLYLSFLSSIVLEAGAKITFDSNHAAGYGGAIYSVSNELLMNLCFIEFSTDPLPKMIFINNTAINGGDAVYINKCPRLQADEETKENIFNIFDFDQQAGDNPPFSSTPYAITFCDNETFQVEGSRKNIFAHPGEIVKFHIEAFGVNSATSAGLVKVDILDKNGRHLETKYETSKTECFDISYSVTKANDIDELLINIITDQEQISNYGFRLLQKNVSAFVKILPCPVGFELFENECICNKKVEDVVQSRSTVSCDISTLTFTTGRGVWLGYENNTHPPVLQVVPSCPFDYCKNKDTSFLIHNSNEQCRHDRSDTACGSCAEGLSLVLGSNECKECSNLWLILIIPLVILAGLALVGLLMLLDLTVSVGTINGVIFYANVIKLNEISFFPNGSVPLLSQFIAWVNLDFGITCCFYNGLNAISKLSMQFLFPVYIFCIIILIIILCKLSTTVSKIFGKNGVQVFATLILISYTKLFRLVVPIIQYQHMTVIDASTNQERDQEIIWSADPSTSYTDPFHIVLVAFAILVLLLLVIPYTLILTFQPVMLGLRLSPYQKLCLSLKPLFDAYYGPFKMKKCRVWPGMLLWARLVLVIVASFAAAEVYLSCCVCVVGILLTCMIVFQGVYSNSYLNVLESCFLLNLAVMAVFVDESRQYVSMAGVCIALLMFLGIICFHIYKKWKKFANGSRYSSIDEPTITDSADIPISRDHVSTSKFEREPIIFQMS